MHADAAKAANLVCGLADGSALGRMLLMVTAVCASLGKVLAVPEPALGVAGRDGA